MIQGGQKEIEEPPSNLERLRSLILDIDTKGGEFTPDDDYSIAEAFGFLGERVWSSPTGQKFYTARGQKLIYEPSPYDAISTALHIAKPGPSDAVCDLGSGTGTFCLYGVLTTPAKFTGIEFMHHLVQIAEGVKNRFSIPNVSFIEGDVLDQDLSKYNKFYLFDPFEHPGGTTLEQTIEKLREVARRKHITIMAYGWDGMSDDFGSLPWLSELEATRRKNFGLRGVGVYESL